MDPFVAAAVLARPHGPARHVSWPCNDGGNPQTSERKTLAREARPGLTAHSLTDGTLDAWLCGLGRTGDGTKDMAAERGAGHGTEKCAHIH
jgi:hypothetical protein